MYIYIYVSTLVTFKVIVNYTTCSLFLETDFEED